MIRRLGCGGCKDPRFAFGLLVVGLLLAGCGGGDGLVSVSGQVTWQDQPIEDGEIRFLMSGASTEAGLIRAGRYAARIPAGKGIVQIFGFQETDSKQFLVDVTGDPEAHMKVNYVPAKYNEQTSLEFEVTGSTTQLDFHLGSSTGDSKR